MPRTATKSKPTSRTASQKAKAERTLNASQGENKPQREPRGIIKMQEPNVNKGDNSRYLRHALANRNMPPIDISDPKQVQERVDWYFNHCVEDDMKPTVMGLANSLGVDRKTLNNWRDGTYRANNKAREHLHIVKRAYDLLEEMYEDYMMNGKINPVAGIFMGKNHFGYTDQQEVILTPNDPLGDTENTKQLQDKYVETTFGNDKKSQK